MKVSIVLAALALAACGNDHAQTHDHDGGPIDAPVDAPDDNTFDKCDGDAASFVRQTFLALNGRRPSSQAEVDVYVDLYNAATANGDDAPGTVARAIMNRPEFAERWVDLLMDGLHVQRTDIQTEQGCWDLALRQTVTPALAQAVRDQKATQTGDGQQFTMLDLARSALALDDLTPIYRAQLFSLVEHPIPAANVDDVEAELARRADFGVTFDAAYLHRDIVCLGCHTSEMSVTDNDDPDLDRHWPVAGAPERAVFGMPTGVDVDRAHAVFRYASFGDSGSTRPWGWMGGCGRFASPGAVPNDLAGVDAKLASITGEKATVFDLEQALQRGFAALEASGAPTAALTDPDTALAWLVTLKMTEDVYKQVTGTSLTIANYFPRNQASSDLLYSLAGTFVASHYSLKALLVAVVETHYFNRRAPDEGCGAGPYIYPNVFDPWVIADSDVSKRKNGPGDAVSAIAARTLVNAAGLALEWGQPPFLTRFPDSGFGNDSDEVVLQRGIGAFLRNSEPGFRGLDFQARLAWENRYGACAKPNGVSQDFVDRLAAAGLADSTATGADVVAALKDRLIGEPAIAAGAEHDALAALLGASLEGPATAVSAGNLRRVCGALLGSPQFLLQGVAGRGGPRPKLTPAAAGYDSICASLAATGIGVTERTVSCGTGTLTLSAAH